MISEHQKEAVTYWVSTVILALFALVCVLASLYQGVHLIRRIFGDIAG